MEKFFNSGAKKVQDVLGITDKKELDKWVADNNKNSKRKAELEEFERDAKEQKRDRDTERQLNEAHERYTQNEKNRVEQEKRQSMEVLDDFSDLNRIEHRQSNDTEMGFVNPYYYTDDYEYTMNCAYCTATYELRKRGYDVEVSAISEEARNTPWEIRSWYNDAPEPDIRKIDTSNTANSEKQLKSIENEMLSHGEGARGNFNVYWTSGGGHSVAWEVKNGKVVIRDCQTNTVHEMSDYVDRVHSVDYFRTDNLSMNTNVLKAVRNREGKYTKKASAGR